MSEEEKEILNKIKSINAIKLDKDDILVVKIDTVKYYKNKELTSLENAFKKLFKNNKVILVPELEFDVIKLGEYNEIEK